MACWSYFVSPSSQKVMAITPRMMIQSQLRSTPFRRRQWRAKSQRHKISSPNRRSHCRFGCLLRGFVRGCGWDWPTGKYLLSNSPPLRNVPKIRLLEVSKIRSSVRHRRARVMWGGTLFFPPMREWGWGCLNGFWPKRGASASSNINYPGLLIWPRGSSSAVAVPARTTVLRDGQSGSHNSLNWKTIERFEGDVTWSILVCSWTGCCRHMDLAWLKCDQRGFKVRWIEFQVDGRSLFACNICDT